MSEGIFLCKCPIHKMCKHNAKHTLCTVCSVIPMQQQHVKFDKEVDGGPAQGCLISGTVLPQVIMSKCSFSRTLHFSCRTKKETHILLGQSRIGVGPFQTTKKNKKETKLYISV